MKSKLFTKTNIIIVLLLLVIVILLSILFKNNFFMDAADEVSNSELSGEISSNYEMIFNKTEEELNIIYAEVIERNKKMFENPAEYGDEFCSPYVSTTKDLTLHNKILDELKSLSDEICREAETDYDKVKLIAYWVAENIYYNHVAANSEVNADVISLETVLKTRTATCAGYSNMFSALCNMQDIYCVNLRGGTYVKENTAQYLMTIAMNHEWNAALVDGEWIHVDVTWLSNNSYTEDGYEKVDSTEDNYFDMSFEEMSYEHRIDIIDYRDFKSSVNVLK